MFVDVETVEFFFFGNSEAYGFVDEGEDDKCHYEYEGGCCCYTDELGGKAVVWGEDSCKEGSCCSADSVNADGTYRVIDFCYFIEEFYGEYYECSGDSSDDDC